LLFAQLDVKGILLLFLCLCWLLKRGVDCYFFAIVMKSLRVLILSIVFPLLCYSQSDDFAGDGPLLGYVTNNSDSLPDVARVKGRYRANLTNNADNITLHYHDEQGRLDAKLVSFPFVYIARNIGIGTQADSQVSPPHVGDPYNFCGVQVHVTDLESRNSSHVVIGHRGGARNTIEGKNTVEGVSSVNDDGYDALPLGRGDIKIEGTVDRRLVVSWQEPNLSGDVANDNFQLYRDTGNLPGAAPSYGEQVYIGLITYAYATQGVPFVGTCDEIQFTQGGGEGNIESPEIQYELNMTKDALAFAVLEADTGVNYQLQSSSDFEAWVTIEELRVEAAQEVAFFSSEQALESRRAFYRIRATEDE